MRLTVVGCAGSFPGPESAASSYLFEADGFAMVIDMGNGSLGPLQRFAPLFGIDAVCLSHLHADHCTDLYSYRVARQIAAGGPLPPLPVYGPAGTPQRLALLHGPDGDEGLADRLRFEVLRPGTAAIGPFAVTVDHMNHPVETFGFRVEHGGKVVAYSADTGESPALVKLADRADLLVCEASFLSGPDLPPGVHLSAAQAGEHASRAGVGQLMLTHLVAWNDPLRSVAEARDCYDGTVTAARTGTVIELGDSR